MANTSPDGGKSSIVSTIGMEEDAQGLKGLIASTYGLAEELYNSVNRAKTWAIKLEGYDGAEVANARSVIQIAGSNETTIKSEMVNINGTTEAIGAADSVLNFLNELNNKYKAFESSIAEILASKVAIEQEKIGLIKAFESGAFAGTAFAKNTFDDSELALSIAFDSEKAAKGDFIKEEKIHKDIWGHDLLKFEFHEKSGMYKVIQRKEDGSEVVLGWTSPEKAQKYLDTFKDKREKTDLGQTNAIKDADANQAKEYEKQKTAEEKRNKEYINRKIEELKDDEMDEYVDKWQNEGIKAHKEDPDGSSVTIYDPKIQSEGKVKETVDSYNGTKIEYAPSEKNDGKISEVTDSEGNITIEYNQNPEAGSVNEKIKETTEAYTGTKTIDYNTKESTDVKQQIIYGENETKELNVRKKYIFADGSYANEYYNDTTKVFDSNGNEIPSKDYIKG